MLSLSWVCLCFANTVGTHFWTHRLWISRAVRHMLKPHCISAWLSALLSRAEVQYMLKCKQKQIDSHSIFWISDLQMKICNGECIVEHGAWRSFCLGCFLRERKGTQQTFCGTHRHKECAVSILEVTITPSAGRRCWLQQLCKWCNTPLKCREAEITL